MRPWQAVLRVVVAGIRAGSRRSTRRAPVGLPAAVRRALSDQGVAVFVETDEQWIQRIVGTTDIDRRGGGCGIRVSSAAHAPGRARGIGRRAASRRSPRPSAATPTSRSTTNEVTTAGRLELLPFLHEQSITITAHRFGNPDGWSERVI